MIVIQNEKLNEYISTQVDSAWDERDFVKLVKSYLNQTYKKILAIGGLKGLGKTVGVLQAITNLDACYICIENESAKKCISILEEVSERIIVIDNYSELENREILDEYLGKCIQNDKRIILIDGSSLIFEEMNESTIFHQLEILNIPIMNYAEYSHINSLAEYIDVAIVSELIKSNECTLCKEKAEYAVYQLFFKIISGKQYSARFNKTITMEYFLEMMGLENFLDVSLTELSVIENLLERMGVVIRIPNYDSSAEEDFRLFITIPSVLYQLLRVAYDINEDSFELKSAVFDSCVATTAVFCCLEDHNVLFLDDASLDIQHIVIVDSKRDFAYLISSMWGDELAISEDSVFELRCHIEEELLGQYFVFCGKARVLRNGDYEALLIPLGPMLTRYFEFNTNKASVKFYSD